MVVHQIDVGEDPETEQIYEMDGENASSDQVHDEAFNEIVEEDIFFENNKDRLSLNSDQIDLCLLDK